ncbi:MAG TPA: trypco2 family protein [Streptosporangiaceae bacterium]|nr:trypco2 family protein [Streptosporangiaceae bacterium]
MAQEIGDLAEAIAALRAGLEAALAEGQGRDVQFSLGDVELTLQLVAEKHAGGKIGWSVLGADAGGRSERTHSLKLVLKPRLRQADGSYSEQGRVADQSEDAPGVGVRRT